MTRFVQTMSFTIAAGATGPFGLPEGNIFVAVRDAQSTWPGDETSLVNQTSRIDCIEATIEIKGTATGTSNVGTATTPGVGNFDSYLDPADATGLVGGQKRTIRLRLGTDTQSLHFIANGLTDDESTLTIRFIERRRDTVFN